MTDSRTLVGGLGAGGISGGGLVLGPVTNAFAAATTAAAETARDTYAAANATWLAEYDANPTWAITITETTGGTTTFQSRRGSTWADVTPVARGDRGRQGIQGQQGDQGPQGIQGDMGVQGNRGPQGDPGNPGTPGAQGPPGDEGPQGPQGDDGPTGPAGPRGPQGVPGTQGPAGTPGNADVTGILAAQEADPNQDIEFIVGQTGQRPFTITMVAGTNSIDFQQPPEGTAVGTIAPTNSHILGLSFYESDYGVSGLNARWRATVAEGVALQTLVIDGHELALTRSGATPSGNRHWLTAAAAYTPSAGDLDFSVRLIQDDDLDLGAVEIFATLNKQDLGSIIGTHQDNYEQMARGIEGLPGTEKMNREDLVGNVVPRTVRAFPGVGEVPPGAVILIDQNGQPAAFVADDLPPITVANRNRISVTPLTDGTTRTWNLGDTYTQNYEDALGYLRISGTLPDAQGDPEATTIEMDIRDDLSGLPGRGPDLWIDFIAPTSIPAGIRRSRVSFDYGFDLPSAIIVRNGITYRRYRHEDIRITPAEWGTGEISIDLYTGEVGTNAIDFSPATIINNGRWYPIGQYRGNWLSGGAYYIGDVVRYGAGDAATLYLRVNTNVATSTTANLPPTTDGDWIQIGISSAQDVVSRLEHLPATERLNYHALQGTAFSEVLQSLPPTTDYRLGDIIVVQSSDSSTGILYYLAADYDVTIPAADRADIDITLDSLGVYDPSHSRGETTLNYNTFVNEIIVHQNSSGTYTIMLALNRGALLALADPAPGNIFLELDNAFATALGVSAAGGISLQESNLGYRGGTTVQSYVKQDLTAAQGALFANRRIQAALRNGTLQTSPRLSYRPASYHVGSSWRQLGGATGGMGAVGQGQVNSNPVSTDVIDMASLSPELRGWIDPRFDIIGSSSNLSYTLIGWYGSQYTPFRVNNDVPFLPSSAVAISNVSLPNIYQTASAGDTYHRYIDYPNAMTVAHGFTIGSLTPLANTGDSLVVYMTVHPYSLPTLGSRTLLSIPQIPGRHWNLQVDEQGNLNLYDGTNSVQVASALSADTTARIKVQIVRLADSGGNQQYRGYLQVDGGSSVNHLGLSVTASGNVLDSSPTVTIGNTAANPSLNNSFRGWLADIIVASGTGGTEAPAPGTTEDRGSPYGSLFTISTTTSPTSVLRLSPLPNLLTAPLAIPATLPYTGIDVPLDEGYAPSSLEGIIIEVRPEASYHVRAFVPMGYFPIRTQAQAQMTSDNLQAYVTEVNGFFQAGRGTVPTSAGTFSNSFFLSLIGDTTRIDRLRLWATSLARGINPYLIGIYLIPRRR